MSLEKPMVMTVSFRPLEVVHKELIEYLPCNLLIDSRLKGSQQVLWIT